jgi:hypothetical protein
MTLPMFEDHAVRGASLRITNTGDGLSEAFKISPHALDLGSELYLIVRGFVTQINHVDKGGGLIRVHTVRAEEAIEVDGDQVKTLMVDAADRLERARAAAAGQPALDADE